MENGTSLEMHLTISIHLISNNYLWASSQD